MERLYQTAALDGKILRWTKFNIHYLDNVQLYPGAKKNLFITPF